MKRNNGVASGRPKAPDRQVVTCAFDGESLHLTFLIPEGTASLSVTDETLLLDLYGIRDWVESLSRKNTSMMVLQFYTVIGL